MCYTQLGDKTVRYGNMEVLRMVTCNSKIRCFAEKKLLTQQRQGNKPPRNLREEYFWSKRKTFKGPEVGTHPSHE